MTLYQDYVSQVSEKVNEDGSVKPEFASDKKFTVAHAFMKAVLNSKEWSPPGKLDIDLPCFDGWTTPASHQKRHAEVLMQ